VLGVSPWVSCYSNKREQTPSEMRNQHTVVRQISGLVREMFRATVVAVQNARCVRTGLDLSPFKCIQVARPREPFDWMPARHQKNINYSFCTKYFDQPRWLRAELTCV